jgi:hypothetical protein
MNALLACSLGKEAVLKLRSAKAWKYDGTMEHTIFLNMAYVRTIFHERKEVKKLILLLHPNKRNR